MSATAVLYREHKSNKKKEKKKEKISQNSLMKIIKLCCAVCSVCVLLRSRPQKLKNRKIKRRRRRRKKEKEKEIICSLCLRRYSACRQGSGLTTRTHGTQLRPHRKAPDNPVNGCFSMFPVSRRNDGGERLYVSCFCLFM